MAKQAKGVSVGEIEQYTKKYGSQILLIVAIVIAMISSIFDFFISANWGILLASAGVIYGIFLPKHVETMFGKVMSFSRKDRTTEILMGIVRIIVAIFIPALIFGMMGLLAGAAVHKHNHRA